MTLSPIFVPMPAFNPDRYWKSLTILLFALVIAIRLSLYIDARSLIIDEANLTFNVVERGYLGFFSPLGYHQYAPPLFMVVMKAYVQAWGVHEFALRLFPMLCSFVALALVFAIGRRLTDHRFALLPLVLVGLSPFFLRYATEVKQYSTDVMVTLLVVWLALRLAPERISWRGILLWAVVGSVMIWASMPVVFLLAGAGLYYAVAFVQQKAWRHLAWLAIPAVLWLLNFGLFYSTILSKEIGTDYLVGFHSIYFVNFFPASLPELKAQVYLFQNLLNAGVSKVFVSQLLALPLLLAGAVWLLRKRHSGMWLLLVPLLATVAASGLHLFSLIPRVALFMVPLMLLVLTVGAYWVWQWLPQRAKVAVPIALLLLVALQVHPDYLWRPMLIDPIKPAMEHLVDAGDANLPLVVHYEGVASFRFYTGYYAWRNRYPFTQPILTKWDNTPAVIDSMVRTGMPFRLLIVHATKNAKDSLMAPHSELNMTFELDRAWVYEN